jgi:hypothetical protein
MDSGIRSAALRLRWIVTATLAVVALLFVLAQLGVSIGAVRVEAHDSGIAGWQLRAVVTLILLAIAMLRLMQMLGRIAAGELFTPEVVGRFRAFAFWLLMMALFDFLAPILSGIVTPSHDGTRRIAIMLDLRELVIVGLTMLLFLVARLLERARELEAEVQEFV